MLKLKEGKLYRTIQPMSLPMNKKWHAMGDRFTIPKGAIIMFVLRPNRPAHGNRLSKYAPVDRGAILYNDKILYFDAYSSLDAEPRRWLIEAAL
jgi:hypothetical protein